MGNKKNAKQEAKKKLLKVGTSGGPLVAHSYDVKKQINFCHVMTWRGRVAS